MPSNDVNTMTPGSAVADVLQELLARRKAEAQQAFLNQLTLQDKQHDWTNQDAQRDIQKRQVEAQIAKQRFDMGREGALMVPGGAEVSDETTDPLTLQMMRSLGMTKKNPVTTPSVTTTENIAPPQGASAADLEAYARQLETNTPTTTVGNQVPANETAVGNDKYQAEQLQREMMNRYITEHQGELAKNPRLLQELGLVESGFKRDVPDSATEPDEPIGIYDEASGEFSQTPDKFPKGMRVVTRNRPPQPNAASYPKLTVFQLKAPDGSKKTEVLDERDPNTRQVLADYTKAGYEVVTGRPMVEPPAFNPAAVSKLVSTLSIKAKSSREVAAKAEAVAAAVGGVVGTANIPAQVAVDIMNLVTVIEARKAAGQSIGNPIDLANTVAGATDEEKGIIARAMSILYPPTGAQ